MMRAFSGTVFAAPQCKGDNAMSHEPPASWLKTALGLSVVSRASRMPMRTNVSDSTTFMDYAGLAMTKPPPCLPRELSPTSAWARGLAIPTPGFAGAASERGARVPFVAIGRLTARYPSSSRANSVPWLSRSTCGPLWPGSSRLIATGDCGPRG
jgi:hypothetical protein